jgi:Lar family restriction alleviation protein
VKMNEWTWPTHELANYRIARTTCDNKLVITGKEWNRVLTKALRLAEAIDEIDKRKKKKAMKQCPFCGGKRAQFGMPPITGGEFIVCTKCGARGPLVDKTKEARAAWNKRHAK